MEKTSTKLFVIVITTAAIIAMATTTSLSAATPAFAKANCTDNPDGTTVCIGGGSNKKSGVDVPGGGGGRFEFNLGTGEITTSGGSVGGREAGHCTGNVYAGTVECRGTIPEP